MEVDENNKTRLGFSAGSAHRGDRRTWSLLIILAALWILFHISTDGIFLSSINISNLMAQTAVTGILACGMLLVIVAGKIDLSAGSVMGLTGGVAALLLSEAGAGFAVALCGALAVSVVIGCLHGALVARFGIPAFVVTLGGLLAWRGALKWLTNAETVPISDEAFLSLGQQFLDPRVGWSLAIAVAAAIAFSAIRKRISSASREAHATKEEIKAALQVVAVIAFVYVMNSYAGVPMPVLVLIFAACAAHFIAMHTVLGRHLYAIGGNTDAARLSGVNVQGRIVAVYALMGLFTAISAIVLSARLESSLPDAGVLKELDAVAACVIGGASLSGGRGSVVGAVLGALIMSSLDNGMGLLGISAFKQEMIKGAILVAAVGADGFGRFSRRSDES